MNALWLHCKSNDPSILQSLLPMFSDYRRRTENQSTINQRSNLKKWLYVLFLSSSLVVVPLNVYAHLSLHCQLFIAHSTVADLFYLQLGLWIATVLYTQLTAWNFLTLENILCKVIDVIDEHIKLYICITRFTISLTYGIV